MAVNKKKVPAKQTKKAKKAPTTQQIRAVQNAKKKIGQVEKRNGIARTTAQRYRLAKQENKLTPPEFRRIRDASIEESIRLMRRQKRSDHGKVISYEQVKAYYIKSYMIKRTGLKGTKVPCESHFRRIMRRIKSNKNERSLRRNGIRRKNTEIIQPDLDTVNRQGARGWN